MEAPPEVVETTAPAPPFDWMAWDSFLRANLAPDLAPWRRRAPLRTADLLDTYEREFKPLGVWSILQPVLIYNNRVYWPDRPRPNATTATATGPATAYPDAQDQLNSLLGSPYNVAFQLKLSAALQSGALRLPNVLLLYNTDDNAPRLNSPERNQTVPLFSLFKSLGLGPAGDDLDILVPQTLLTRLLQLLVTPNTLYDVPWEAKKDVAFFRGTCYCSYIWEGRPDSGEPMCPRTHLALLSDRDRRAAAGEDVGDIGGIGDVRDGSASNSSAPSGGRPAADVAADGAAAAGAVLDVAMTDFDTSVAVGTDQGGRPLRYPLPAAEQVPIAQHARYKWLLALEGITASHRLGQLFMTDSLVVAQRTPFVEYYNRALREWEHYVPFWEFPAPGWEVNPPPGRHDDVYDVIQELRRLDSEEPDRIQGMIEKARSFAVRFLSLDSRLLYYRSALSKYKAMFPDMDAFIEEYVARLRAQGWSIPAAPPAKLGSRRRATAASSRVSRKQLPRQ